MIYLDSDFAAGMPADSCVLNHLDLAINYYHLFRVEKFRCLWSLDMPTDFFKPPF